jgi:hypothetical protein
MKVLAVMIASFAMIVSSAHALEVEKSHAACDRKFWPGKSEHQKKKLAESSS